MKSNSLLKATLLLGIGIGISIGYGLGRRQGPAAGETAQIPNGQQPQNAGSSTAFNHSKSPRSTAKPTDTAKGLLHAMLHSKGGGADPVGRMQFRQALSQCDEATLSDLIEELRETSARDPEKFSAEHREALDSSHLMVERMATLAPMKALEALLGFNAANMPFKVDNLDFIFSILAQQDPSQIPAALAKMEAGGMKSVGERAWLLSQAKADPDAVFQVLMRRQDKAQMSRDDLRDVAECLGLYAPEKALTLVQEYDDTGNRDRVLASVMASWFQRDPSSAYSYAMVQKDANLVLACLPQFPFESEYEVDYAALRKDFPDLKSSNPEDRQALACIIAANLAGQDANAARQWVATLPTAEQTKANTAIAETWIANDPAAASEWLATWPTGEAKESAVCRLIDKIKGEDPERAFTWAINCLHGRRRYSALDDIMESFATKDPDAGGAARASLSAEDRTLLDFNKKNFWPDPFAR